jgi:flagellar basal-body rod protein FlgC
MNLFGMLEVSGSALAAERARAEVVVANMANAETTRTAEGGPYRRQLVVFRAHRMARFPLLLAGLQADVRSAGQGVQVTQVVADASAPVQRFQPGHPDADAQGYVSYPAINPVEEMTDLLSAVRSYELNASAIQATKNMLQQALEILR